jgi:hypothetical protein
MQSIDLNLASRPFKNNTLLWVGHCTAILLLMMFTVWNVRTFREHSRMLDALRAQLGTTESEFQLLDLRDQRARSQISSFDMETLAIQAYRANQVIDWQAFSWTRLFNRMAQVQPYDVKMVAIRPIFHGGQREVERATGEPRPEGVPVLIEGIGKNHEAVFELHDSLQADPYFSRVYPERMNRIPGGEILFKLRFVYLPEREDEQAEAPEAQLAHAEGQAEAGPVDGVPEGSGSATGAEPGRTPDVQEVEDEWAGAGEADTGAAPVTEPADGEPEPAAGAGSPAGKGSPESGQAASPGTQADEKIEQSGEATRVRPPADSGPGASGAEPGRPPAGEEKGS